ncbi:hypothetical protein [Alicyclobacillus sp. ALC3]|uniref:hypothetical protein n=1 Tax=Alicyclobacillus sp. ALC3 TaxID=2796143 RepID=UPI002378A073|nr:hypothetical protein [Alicyclobacillus sp. ALC3]WDL98498.1 hypothetical protein JC200_07405 [Alicyclobacillus sp. ALC3]
MSIDDGNTLVRPEFDSLHDGKFTVTVNQAGIVMPTASKKLRLKVGLRTKAATV